MINRLTLLTLLFLGLCQASLAGLAFSFEIRGLHDPELSNVQSYLAANMPKKKHRDVTVIHEHFANMSKQIHTALQPFGHFHAQIHAKLVHVHGDWKAIFKINPGIPVTIRTVHIHITGPGSHHRLLQRTIENAPLKQGMLLNTIAYEKLKQDLFHITSNKGYVHAHIVKSEVQVSLHHHKADISLQFETGPRYRFGEVIFAPTKLNDSFLARYLTFHPGEFYSPTKLLQLQQHLISSNYFTRVIVRPMPPDEATQTVPIHVDLELGKAATYSAGIGYGTDVGPRATLGLQLHRITETGHHLAGVVKASKKESSAHTHYFIPMKNPVTDVFSINLLGEDSSLGKGERRTFKAGVSSTKYLHHWQQTFALDFQHERSRKTKAENFNTATMLIPSASWGRKQSDDPLHPTHGYRLDFSLRGAAKPLASETSFIQAQIEAKYLTTLAQKHRIILKAEFGTSAVSNFDKMPLSLLFRTGGSQTVRGHGYNSLGPGKNYLVASAEYQYRVTENWYAALFYDAGNAFNTKPGLKQSPGVGVVWLSPLGPIKLSFANAINSEGKPWVVQFNMGPEL